MAPVFAPNQKYFLAPQDHSGMQKNLVSIHEQVVWVRWGITLDPKCELAIFGIIMLIYVVMMMVKSKMRRTLTERRIHDWDFLPRGKVSGRSI